MAGVSAANMQEAHAIKIALTKLSEKATARVTLKLVDTLIQTTPIDTGWARVNWIPSAGTPYEANLNGIKPNTALVSDGKNKQNFARADMISYTFARGPIYVTNNVPYIRRLNNGHSQQQPAGFVERAISKAVQVTVESV